MSENVALSGRQYVALDSLLADGDRTLAARKAGVSDRTMARWLHEPAFADALQASQDTTLDRVTSDLVKAASGAVALLAATIDNADAALGLRLQAARTLLDAALRWKELRDVERRLMDLEAQIEDTRQAAR